MFSNNNKMETEQTPHAVTATRAYDKKLLLTHNIHARKKNAKETN